MGEAGRAIVRKRFALDAIATRISRLYDNAVNTRFPATDLSDRLPDDCRNVARGPGALGMKQLRLGTDAPTLSIVVDTESAFDWSKGIAADHGRVESISNLTRFQDVCDEFGVRVCYVVDYPVSSNPVSAAVMRNLVERGAEIGAHLQPWTTPPVIEPLDGNLAFPGNLPPSLEKLKLQSLKAMIEANIGVTPRVYKAGRYGISNSTLELLEELGFDIDLSVAPSFRLCAGRRSRLHPFQLPSLCVRKAAATSRNSYD